MKSVPSVVALVIVLSQAGWGQEPSAQPSAKAAGQQGSAVEAAKPAEPEGHKTMIGCLAGPDNSGKYLLRSMEHRTGVEVFGSDELKKGSGEKVKLTGSWASVDEPAVKGKEGRRFRVSEVEVISESCSSPSEQTPISKEKQAKQAQQQKKKQQQSSAPSSGDATNPK